MRKNSKEQRNKLITFNCEEEKLLKKYIDEYNDLFQKILILSPNDFIQILKKMLLISLKEKINGFSGEVKSKIEDFIIEHIYCHDYKYALFAKRRLMYKKNQNFILKENEQILSHCEHCKKDGNYIHECGNPFQIFKYKSLIFSSNISEIKCINNLLKPKYILYCGYCDMIYKSDLIKFKCNLTQENFYSKITEKNSSTNTQLVTFKKYHCNIIINDTIKCQKCSEDLYYINDSKILCKKCNKEFDPRKLGWKCIKCKKDFTAEIKVYNPLEYKNMKICVKEAIYNKKKARPEYMGCNCNVDNINKINFFHKNNCKGTLYQWELNNKKVVVCQECESLGNYEGYTWTCPLCFKRFKINPDRNKEKKENKDNNKIIKDTKEKINDNFNYSKNNFYNIKINNNNNNGIYISPHKLKSKYSFNQRENTHEKEIIKKDENNNNKNKILRRVNSAAKLNILNRREKYQTGLPSPSKNIINNIKLIENKENKTPNITLINNNKENNIKSNAIYNKRNKLISNIDLNDVNKLNNIYNKFIGTSKEKQNEKKNSEYSVSPINKNKNYDLRYKKNIIENSSKIVNKSPIKKFKRSYSSCFNDRKIEINEIKNDNAKTPNKVNNNKIPKNYRREITKNVSNKKEEIKKKLSPGKFNINDYKIKRQIGEGSFGQIFLVEDKEKNQYALKKIIADSSDDINSIKQEYQILIDIQNNNKSIDVVNIIGISNYKLDMTTHVLYVLMELASTDWEKEILKRKNQKKYYDENELMKILSVLIKSLSVLQKQNISHRDIKPQNILVFYKDKNAIYKLADFGEAKELYRGDKPTNRQTLRGTELYMSPILFYALRASRVMKYVKHNPFKSDVFSFGLCALFAASLCFESLYDVRELKSNVSLKIVVNRYLKGRYSYRVIDIITKMLDINETTRYDFVELNKEFEKLGY